MRVVEASADTREAAIEKALAEMGVEMHDVDNIEIVDEGSKGLFGFGARKVRVKVTVERLPAVQEEAPRTRGRRGGRGGEGRKEREERPPQQEQRGERKPRAPEEGRGGGERRRGRGGKSEEASPKPQREERPERQRERKPRPPREAGEQQPQPRAERPPAAKETRREEEHAEPDIAPISDEQGRDAAAMLQEIISKMGMESKAEFARAEDGSARINVSAEDSAILIGRKGRTLQAMQYLVNRMVSRQDEGENIERLVVDVEGYVERREESLRETALKMAERAKSTGRNMRLKPLSPQERRIIHLTLQDDEELRTFSLGESLYRSVVISPKNQSTGQGQDQDQERPRSNRSRGGRGGSRRGGRRGQGRRQDDDFDAGAVSE